MIDNLALFHRLLDAGDLAMSPSRFLEAPPASLDGVDPARLWDRVEGLLLGLAVGDALGNTSESLRPADRARRFGEIRDYLPNPRAGGRPMGLPSDDTQLAFWTLEQLVEDDGLEPDHLARRFCSGRIFGLGRTVRDFLVAYGEGARWEAAGQRSAGNGALMRIAPVLLPHLRRPSPSLWADAALAGMVTHDDPASNAACVAFVHLLWEALRLDRVPEADWWLDTFLGPARELEGEARYRSRVPGSDYEGPVSRFAEAHVRAALALGLTVREAQDASHSGAYLLETVPTVLHVLARHGHDPEEAIVRAVNDTVDNDTVAAIVGAAVGAVHGRRALPARWIEGLAGRTREDDDGAVFRIVARAREAFGPRVP